MLDEKFLNYASKIYEESLSMGIASIPEEDSLYIYGLIFIHALGSHSKLVAIDLGAGIGYSTLWIAKALDDACKYSGCTAEVLAVEKIRRRASIAKNVVSDLLLDNVKVFVHSTLAEEILASLNNSSVDIAFVDIDKESYTIIAEILERKLKQNGLVIFHNAILPPPPRSFIEKMTSWPWASTIIPTRLGLLIAKLLS